MKIAYHAVDQTIVTPVEEGRVPDPVKGLRRGALETVEDIGRAVAYQDTSSNVEELGVLNSKYEEDPLVEGVLDTAIGIGAGASIGSTVGANTHWSVERCTNAGMAIGGATEATIKAVNYKLDK